MKSADHAHSPKKSRRAFVSLSQCVQCVKRHSNVYLPHARLIVGAASRTRPYPAPAAVAWWRHEKEKSWELFLFAKVAQTTLCEIQHPTLNCLGIQCGFKDLRPFPEFLVFSGNFWKKKKSPKLFSGEKFIFLTTKKIIFFQLLHRLAIASSKGGFKRNLVKVQWTARLVELKWKRIGKFCSAHNSKLINYGMNEALILLSLTSVLPERLLARANYRFDLSTQHTP